MCGALDFLKNCKEILNGFIRCWFFEIRLKFGDVTDNFELLNEIDYQDKSIFRYVRKEFLNYEVQIYFKTIRKINSR